MQDPGAEWLSYAALKFLTQLSELTNVYYFLGFPRWCSGKESRCQCRRHKRRGFDPWVRKIPWRRKWQPTPVFLPGKSHGRRSLVGYSLWSCKRVGHNLATKQKQQQWFYSVFFFLFIFMAPLCCVACGILVPWPWIEPMLPVVEAQILNHWAIKEFP